jgi:hypothetical protein
VPSSTSQSEGRPWNERPCWDGCQHSCGCRGAIASHRIDVANTLGIPRPIECLRGGHWESEARRGLGAAIPPRDAEKQIGTPARNKRPAPYPAPRYLPTGSGRARAHTICCDGYDSQCRTSARLLGSAAPVMPEQRFTVGMYAMVSRRCQITALVNTLSSRIELGRALARPFVFVPSA